MTGFKTVNLNYSIVFRAQLRSAISVRRISCDICKIFSKSCITYISLPAVGLLQGGTTVFCKVVPHLWVSWNWELHLYDLGVYLKSPTLYTDIQKQEINYLKLSGIFEDVWPLCAFPDSCSFWSLWNFVKWKSWELRPMHISWKKILASCFDADRGGENPHYWSQRLEVCVLSTLDCVWGVREFLLMYYREICLLLS